LFAAAAPVPDPALATIPGGEFQMGDHHGFVDPKHGGDETPIHKVRVDGFKIGVDPVTTAQYCAFLNSALGPGALEVRNGGVFPTGGRDLLCETRVMSGNVWQFVNDWYERGYYAYSPEVNPPGPAEGSVMPDGKTYRGMRGGNWYNSENGHGRVSNRNPSYYRGPQDPAHPYYHLGFRIALPIHAETRPISNLTPVQKTARDGPPRGNRQPGGPNSSTPPPIAPSIPKTGFVLRSPEVTDGGMLPKDYTGDGSSATLPLAWSGAPSDTRSYALIMHHIPGPGGEPKWYWVIYDIPASTTALPRNVQNVGIIGSNSINNRGGYAPPHSKGPGPKTYILYALCLVLRSPAQCPARAGQSRCPARRDEGPHPRHGGTACRLFAP
jgi:phosphatidylethanolamine-binding protein (PEBP) family uncharacterized protein